MANQKAAWLKFESLTRRAFCSHSLCRGQLVRASVRVWWPTGVFCRNVSFFAGTFLSMLWSFAWSVGYCGDSVKFDLPSLPTVMDSAGNGGADKGKGPAPAESRSSPSGTVSEAARAMVAAALKTADRDGSVAEALRAAERGGSAAAGGGSQPETALLEAELARLAVSSAAPAPAPAADSSSSPQPGTSAQNALVIPPPAVTAAAGAAARELPQM